MLWALGPHRSTLQTLGPRLVGLSPSWVLRISLGQALAGRGSGQPAFLLRPGLGSPGRAVPAGQLQPPCVQELFSDLAASSKGPLGAAAVGLEVSCAGGAKRPCAPGGSFCSSSNLHLAQGSAARR